MTDDADDLKTTRYVPAKREPTDADEARPIRESEDPIMRAMRQGADPVVPPHEGDMPGESGPDAGESSRVR